MKNVYDKINDVREMVKSNVGHFTEPEFHKIVDHICREQTGERKVLTDDERIVKDLLLRNSYKPKTIRSWLYVLTFPRFLQEQIKTGELSPEKARLLYRDYKIKTNKQIEAEILQDIRNYIDSIPNIVDERLKNEQ